MFTANLESLRVDVNIEIVVRSREREALIADKK